MKIQVIAPKDNVKIFIPIPNSLFMNRLICKLMIHYANKYTNEYKITNDQLYQLFRCLKESKKLIGRYDLIDIETSEGEIIKISL